MISLHEVQQDAADILGIMSTLNTAPAVPVLLDDGLQDDAVEAALNGAGACVLVSPAIAGRRTSAAGRLTVMECEFVVQVMVNPAKNAATEGANRNTLELVEAVVSGLTASEPGPGQQRYNVAANFLNIDVHDDGVIGYQIQIIKPCTIP